MRYIRRIYPMASPHVIFVSAVSSEFHRCPPEQRHLFHSYRDILKQAFRVLVPHYEVIVQEDLVQGTGDLLETLDHEIARSTIGQRASAACITDTLSC